MTKWVIIIPLVLFSKFLFSQQKSDVIQQRIEFIAEELEVEDISLEDVFNNLSYYYDNPLNLNAATKDELEQLLLLSDFQINELLLRIEEKGKFKTIYELQELKYWDLTTIENIVPFIKIAEVEEKKKQNLKKILKDSKFEVYMRWIRGIEEKKGYEDVPAEEKEESNSYYWGSPDKLYSRFRMQYKTNLSVGVTMEKDAGEQFFNEKQPNGFDFYSAHAFYKGGKIIRKVAVGDYQVQFGQGLAIWTGYAFGKTADATSGKKNPRGLRQYTSVDETRFLRGGGIEIGWKGFSLTTWASHKGVDGSIQLLDTLANDEERFASSINLTGFHRTNSELERKNSVMETIFGANVKYETRSLQVGVTAVQQAYDTPFERDFRNYNQFEFRGDELLNLSVDYSYVFRNLNVYGEVARSSSSGSFATVQGLSLALSNKASVSMIYRNYPKDYHTFYAHGFGESSRPINEEGLFIGTKFDISKKWSVNAYGDIFKFPWLSFRVDAPSEGYEFLGQLTFKPSRDLEVYARVREQMRQQNSREFEGNLRPIEDVVQRNYRLNLNYKISDAFRWKSRVEYVTVNRESIDQQNGIVLIQDLLYRPNKLPFDIALRYAIFDTDGFDARLYAYEYNLQNVFSIPAYFNDGSRAYIMLHWEFLKVCDLWVRYAAFQFANEDGLGQGPEFIDGSTRSEFSMQLRIKI